MMALALHEAAVMHLNGLLWNLLLPLFPFTLAPPSMFEHAMACVKDGEGVSRRNLSSSDTIEVSKLEDRFSMKLATGIFLV